MWEQRVELWYSACCGVRVEKVVVSGPKNDTTTHLHLDHEQEYKNDDDIICAYNVSDDVCNTTISQLIGQLVEKGQMIDQN